MSQAIKHRHRSKPPPQSSLGRVIEQSHRPLYNRALQLTRNSDEAWDLLQDAAERGLRRLPADLDAEATTRWLNAVMRNLHFDRLRSAERRLQTAGVDLDDYRSEPSTKEVPHWRVVSLSEVRECLSRIHPHLRKVYELRTDKGLTQKRTAELLGIPEATVATRLHRTRVFLRRALEVRLERGLAPPTLKSAKDPGLNAFRSSHAANKQE